MLAFTLLAACNKSDNKKNSITDIPTGKSKIAEVNTSNGIKVTLWSDAALLVGYNKLYFTITDSATGKNVNITSPSLKIEMNMDNMVMGGPVEQPFYNSQNNLYECAAVFPMASGDMMGQWAIVFSFQDLNSTKEYQANFNVSVMNNITETVLTQEGADGNNYMITLIEPIHPTMGMNNIELLIDQQMENDMSFKPADSLTIITTPQMPSMGGMTTSGNINPVLMTNGHYVGKIDLDMTGDWQIDLNIRKGNQLIFDNTHFNFTF